MKNKAFTLIELLAVIVILAIIALIATPIILGIIRNAKDQSATRSAELYVKAAELGVARKNLTGEEINITTCEVQSNGNLKCGNVDIEVDMDKTTATGGKITFNKGKIIKVENLHISDKYCNTDSNNKLVCTKEEGESTGFTGTIYRNSTEQIAIGESIVPGAKQVWCEVNESEGYNSCTDNNWGLPTQQACLDGIDGWEGATCEQGTIDTGLTTYETEEANIAQSIYLKHEVENNIVTESYVCFKHSRIGDDPLCIRGGDPSYYGSESSGNVKILKDFSENGHGWIRDDMVMKKISEYDDFEIREIDTELGTGWYIRTDNFGNSQIINNAEQYGYIGYCTIGEVDDLFVNSTSYCQAD